MVNIPQPGPILASMVAALLLAACAAAPPGDARLEGNWQLQDFRLANSNETRLVGLEPFSMNLGAEGRATGRLNCNTWRGRYDHPRAGDLHLDELVLTRGRCSTEHTHIDMLARAFPSFLEGTASYSIEGREMLLETERGDLLRFHATHRR